MTPEEHISTGNDEAGLRLLQAVVACRVTDVRVLLRQGASPQARTAEGKSALHLIMQSKDYGMPTNVGRDLLAIFLNNGLDINTPDLKGVTALHLVALDTTGTVIRNKLEDLLNFGADIHVRDHQGQTPLHYAATIKSAVALKLLIERGADVNALDNAKRAPLHYAAVRGDAEMIKILLAAGAHVNILSDSGRFPWRYAEEAGHDYLAQCLKAEGQKQRQAVEKKKAADEPWALLGEDRIAHTTVEKQIGYRLTEIFNFSARTYTKIARNLQSGAEGVMEKSFDEFSDKTMIEKAHDNLTRLGGVADRNLIHYRGVDKPTKK